MEYFVGTKNNTLIKLRTSGNFYDPISFWKIFFGTIEGACLIYRKKIGRFLCILSFIKCFQAVLMIQRYFLPNIFIIYS